MPFGYAHVPKHALMQVVLKVTMATELGTDTPFDKHEVVTDIWDAGPDQFSQEPIFVPRPGASDEDDGWVMSMVYDCASDLTQLVILDAQNLKAGPVARIKLPHRIPYGTRTLPLK